MTSLFENTHSKVTEGKGADFCRRVYTVGALYRLLLPELLSVDKAIYLDCDIIINLDIADLWNISTENYCMAGVHDISAAGFEEKVRDWLNGCSSAVYVNSGVLLINLAILRERGDLFSEAMLWADRHIHLMKYVDQDIINAIFFKHIKLIDGRFNNIKPRTRQAMKDSIIHLAGGPRAWEITGLPYQELYWSTYLLSAWGENATREELIRTISSYASPSAPKKHRSLLRRIAGRIYHSKTATISRYIILEVLCRLKGR